MIWLLGAIGAMPAQGVNAMEPATLLRQADRSSSDRRWSSALLLLAITAFMNACGGGGPSPAGSSDGPTSSGSATLSWDAVMDPNLAGYRVYIGTASGAYVQSVPLGNVTTYAVTGLSSGTWYFAATAYDVNGGESIHSNEVSKVIP